jgi:hypothetical protein
MTHQQSPPQEREDYHDQIAVLWAIVNRHRTIGPSIVLDICKHLSAFEGGDQSAALTAAVINFVFPQLEGLRQSKQKAFLDDLEAEMSIQPPRSGGDPQPVSLDLDVSYLRQKAADIYEFD